MQPNWRLFLQIFIFSAICTGAILIVAGFIAQKLPLVGIGILFPCIILVILLYTDRKLKNKENGPQPKD